MIAQLIPVDGGAPIPLNRDLTLVGRSREDCDLFVNQSSVSKLHCIIVKTDGLLFVRDLGSTNGTKVNGQRIIRGALLPGDQLAFANMKFRVHLGPDEAAVAAGREQTEMIRVPSEKDLRKPGAQEPLEEDLGEQDSSSDVRMLDSAE